MPGQHITQRKRQLIPLLAELVHVSLEFIMAASQFAACFAFYEGVPLAFYKGGCGIFLVTSILTTLLSSAAAIEAHRALKNAGRDEGNWVREIQANLVYAFGAVIFIIGTIFFLPGVYEGENEERRLYVAAMLFTVGSLAFVVGASINGLTIAVHGTWLVQNLTTKLSLTALGFSAAGGVFYSMGSPFFFPQLEDITCEEGGEGKAKWSAINLGTHYFVAGGACYLAGAIANLALAVVKHNGHERHHEKHEQLQPQRKTIARATQKTSVQVRNAKSSNKV